MKTYSLIAALALLGSVAIFAYVGTPGETVQVEQALGGEANDKALFDAEGVQVYTDCDLTKPKRTDIANDLKTLKVKNADNSLRGLDAKDKANLKGCEIAKINNIPRTNVKFSGADYDIEIVSMEPMDGGVQVFARAWNPDGTQIGFGADGTVDIERFRIFNPPILVDDPTGNVVRTWKDVVTGEVKIRTLREDTEAAIKESLVHTISQVGKEGSNIIAGSRGNTTSTFYPNWNVETTSVDGVIDTFGLGTNWATVHALSSATGRAFDSGATGNTGVSGKISGSNIFIARGFYLFDTSALPDTDEVSSATFSSMPSENGANGDNDGDDWVSIVQSSPASNTALAAEDFDQCGAVDNPTEGIDAGSRIDVAALSNGVYSNFTLNATGRSWVSKIGITKLGMREGHDIINSAYAGANDTKNGASHYFADEAGSTRDPKLVVEHAAGASSSPVNDDIIYY